MSDSSENAQSRDDAAEAPADAESSDDAAGAEPSSDDEEMAALRQEVEEKYDFDDFGPQDMAEMSPEEWDAAFDPDTWITGEELLARVEADLERQIADRQVFAVLERETYEGQDVLLAYSDEGYAMVYPDGSVEGFGTVLRDVKPTVALCSMDSYEPEPAPEGAVLPTPDEVPEGSGELGNLMLQVVAAVQALAGVGLLVAAALFSDQAGGSLGRLLLAVAGLGFLVIAFVLFLTVANARLSDKFRAEEYRERLRATGLEDGERPAFLPMEEGPPAAEVAADADADLGAVGSDGELPPEGDAQ